MFTFHCHAMFASFFIVYFVYDSYNNNNRQTWIMQHWTVRHSCTVIWPLVGLVLGKAGSLLVDNGFILRWLSPVFVIVSIDKWRNAGLSPVAASTTAGHSIIFISSLLIFRLKQELRSWRWIFQGYSYHPARVQTSCIALDDGYFMYKFYDLDLRLFEVNQGQKS